MNKIKLHGRIHSKRRQIVREMLFNKQSHKCYWCGRELKLYHPVKHKGKHKSHDMMEIDHIIPRCAGGSNAISNLVGSCKRCNIGRGSLYMRGYMFFNILGQESPSDLLRRYSNYKSTRDMNDVTSTALLTDLYSHI